MNRILTPLLLATAALSAAETPKLAGEARLWLRVPAGQSPLPDIRVSSGTATPAPWEKDPAIRARHTDVLFPIRWWDWRELIVRFTPVEDGTVELVLSGPWQEEKPGIPFRQEVLWDDIAAEGASLENGGFESQAEGKPAGWNPLFGRYSSPDTWPLAGAEPRSGKSVAATHQNAPLARTLEVKAGREVSLTLHARAATLPGFVPPKRLGKDTPAHRAVTALRRGVNLGNCWDAPPPYTWGIRYTPEDIDRIADEGFDHIRVPVAWTYHLMESKDGPKIDPRLLTDLEPVLRRALDRKMSILLDWHHFHDLTDDPTKHRARFVAVWETIARHFKSWPPGLFLELLNEPRDALTTEAANPIYADTLSAIRRIDQPRIVFVSPGKWGDIRELDKLRLPDDDDRVAVTVHCYEPFFYTHQDAPWVNLRGLRGVVYPGPPASPLAVPEAFKDNPDVSGFITGYNTLPADRNPCSPRAVRELLDIARDWSDRFGRPVHLGEFGSHDVGDQESRARYSRDVRTLAEARGIPWALWDWKATFGYWDAETNKPLFKQALFD
jgi:endoglucanase